jgi:ABC-type phosphate transport system substrate-binding protein
MRPALIAAFAALPLAACGESSEAEPRPEQTTSVAQASPDAATPAAALASDPQTIPAPFQGRWALTEADCTAPRGEAKGLLRIDPEELTFYESVGTITDIEEASANGIRGEFSFTGEGMTWERDITLELQDGGQALIRREHGEGAASDPFRYSKCP